MKFGAFIVGTDTGVGKTLVTAALARSFADQGFDVGVMKPIETGLLNSFSTRSDAMRLKRAARSRDPITDIRPYGFRWPLAPLDASRLERRRLDMSSLLRTYRRLRATHDILLAEGAGGLYVPISSTLTMADLIHRMRLSVILVGRSGLGGINHALLTLAALRREKISVLALLLNPVGPAKSAIARRQERSTVRQLRHSAEVPVIGPLPYLSRLNRSWEQGISALARENSIKTLAKTVLASG